MPAGAHAEPRQEAFATVPPDPPYEINRSEARATVLRYPVALPLPDAANVRWFRAALSGLGFLVG